MNVLSLFDGMSCGQIALNRANVKYTNYFASEIKKHAIKVTQFNYPNTIQLGDVTKLDLTSLPKIDLLIGGSPCQDFSKLKLERKNLEGEKSRLFYEYLKILKFFKPKYFILENVEMDKESEQQLNEYLGVKGEHLNSNLVSYQNRPRIYWTNIKYEPIFPKLVNFQDYKETCPEICKAYKVNRTPSREAMWSEGKGKGGHKSCKNVTNSRKVYCLTRKQDRSPNSGLIECEDFCRYLTRRELEQAQTVPVGYTNCVSYNQAQDLLGDGWTVDIIAHFLKYI